MLTLSTINLAVIQVGTWANRRVGLKFLWSQSSAMFSILNSFCSPQPMIYKWIWNDSSMLVLQYSRDSLLYLINISYIILYHIFVSLAWPTISSCLRDNCRPVSRKSLHTHILTEPPANTVEWKTSLHLQPAINFFLNWVVNNGVQVQGGAETTNKPLQQI